MAVITWLHLSDWHQGRKEHDRDFVRNKLIPDLRKCQEDYLELRKIDLVFFTGDLAYKGLKSELQEAQTGFLEPVLEVTGCSKDNLFIIPGNHDLDRNGLNSLATDVKKRPDKRTDVHELLATGRPRRMALEPFADYQDWIDSYKPRGFGAFGGADIVEVNGVKVGILGCNSAIMCARNRDSNNEINDYGFLAVGEMQIEESLRKIASADLRIGLIHHPFEWLRDFDKQEVETELRQTCQFILRGHEHSNRVDISSGTAGMGVIIRGGACYSERIPERPIYSNAYNFVQYDTETQTGKVFFRRWSDESHKWIPDHEKGRDGCLPFAMPIASTAPSNTPIASATNTASNSRGLSANLTAANAQFLEETRAKYLDHVASRWTKLELRGIMQTSKTDAVSLDEVYVSLTVEEEVQSKVTRLDVEKTASLSPAERAEYEKQATDTADIRLAKEPLRAVKTEMRTVPIGLPEALRERRHLVVLGDPGAGKTTLARFLARRFALDCRANKPQVQVPVYALPTAERPEPAILHEDNYGDTCLPILLRVADYAEALRQNGNLRLREFLVHGRGEAEISAEAATALFEDALTSGKAFVILDGMDEVAQTADRTTIARKIDDFAYAIGSKNRILVTSRVVGYIAAPLTSGFNVLTIRDMEFDQIERFISRRLIAYEREQTPDASAQIIYVRSNNEITTVIHAVQHNEGVKRLAVNPLLLTILCLIHRTGARLPERRVELYKIASETLLENWRPAQTEQQGRVVRIAEADRLLAPLADWMHEHTDRGLITETKARELLCGFSAARHGLRGNHPVVEAEIEDFWQRLTYDTSVFVKRSSTEYAFLHLTFEEYWAARYLVRDFNQAPAQLRARRHDPRFAEVVLLAIASKSEEDAAHLIRLAIWCPEEQSTHYGYIPSPIETILRRDFLLAARCLVDCTGIEPTLGRAIASELVNIVVDVSTNNFPPLIDNAREALGMLRDTEIGKNAIQTLLRMSEDEDSNVRWSVAKALGTAGQGSPEVIQTLLRMSQDEDSNVRWSVAKALGEAGQGSPEVMQTLLRMSQDEDSNVRWSVADALGEAGQGSPEVMQTLIRMSEDEDSSVRNAVAKTLGTAGQGSPEVIQALLRMSQDEDYTVRGTVARILGKAGQGSPEVMQTLLRMSEDDDSHVRSMVARALGTAGQGSPEVMQTLLRMSKNKDSNVRSTAARALGTAGQGSPEVIQTLLRMSQDEDSNVRWSVAKALGEAGQGSPEVMQTLLRMSQDEDSNVRWSVADALGEAGQGSPEVMQTLIRMSEDEDFIVRWSVADALGEAGQGSPEVIQTLIRMSEDEDSNVRIAVAETLGTAGQGSPEVMQTLLRMSQDEDSDVRSASWSALWKIAPVA